MRIYYTTRFTNRYTGETVDITTGVDDRMEERKGFKKAVAIEHNTRKFDETGRKRYSKPMHGKTYLIWERKTAEGRTYDDARRLPNG